MKISALIATLALSPALLHAQAIQPAQAQTAGHAPVLEARLNGSQPLAATADNRTTSTAPVRISTGVVPPQLIHSVDVASDEDWEWSVAGPERTAEVSMTVDATGKPTHVQIIKSAGSDIDQNVLAAVDQYRFKPATVSNQPSPMDVNLTVNILKPSGW